MIKTFYLLLLVITLFSVQSLAKGGNPRKGSQRKKEKEEQSESEIDSGVPGALKVGKEGILIPDASSDHPIIISDPKDQPLCKPNTPLTSARPVNVLEGYEAMVLANSIANPKSIFMDQADHLLVVSPEQGLFSVRMDECGNTDIQLILENSQMGQPISNGIAVTGQNLYVSTANSVYKFPYSDGQHSPVSEGKIVVNNINPQDTGAITELAVDPFGYMYVPRSINELSSSMDGSSGVIKRFNLRIVPDQGYDFDNDGEVHAFGTNSHGSMSFDAQARLWGLNGLTGTIKRADISASEDLSQAGLAEELNLYEFPQMNYGFPYCMTEYNLQGISSAAKGLGAQWGHPSFMNDSLSLDEYCQNEENNRKPAFNIAANSIASSVAFYMGTFCSVGTLTTGGTSVGLPCNWTDTPIVANHGLSGQAQGHSVVRLPFDDLGHKPRWDKEPEVLLAEAQPCAGPGCLSPSGLTFDTFGRLYVSSDETNEIYIVSRIYNQEASVKLTQLVEAGEEKRDSPNSDEMENFYAKIGDEEARAKHKGKKKKDEDE